MPEVSLVAILDADKEGFFAIDTIINPDDWSCSKKCAWQSDFIR